MVKIAGITNGLRGCGELNGVEIMMNPASAEPTPSIRQANMNTSPGTTGLLSRAIGLNGIAKWKP